MRYENRRLHGPPPALQKLSPMRNPESPTTRPVIFLVGPVGTHDAAQMKKLVWLCGAGSALTLSLAIVSCSDDGAGSSSPVAFDAFCGNVAIAQCQSVQSCCVDETAELPTQNDCITAAKATCDGQLPAANRLAYNPQLAGQELQSFEQSGDACGQPHAIDFARILSGSGMSGEDCSDGTVTCATGLVCASSNPATPLIRSCQPLAGANQACSATIPCQDGLMCMFAAPAPAAVVNPAVPVLATGVCQGPPGVGQACTQACAEGAFCRLTPGLATGACLAKLGIGQGCNNASECISTICKPNPTAATQAALVVPAPATATGLCSACESSFDCTQQGNLCDGGNCVDASAVSGLANGSRCLLNENCQGGACVGEVCLDLDQNALYCPQ